MRATLMAVLALTLTLSACGAIRESRFNPLNWFGRSEASRVEEAQSFVRPADPRALVDQVTAMTVEQVPGGAIVRATGLPPTQGFWDAELVRVDQVIETRGSDGTVTRVVDRSVLVYDFRIAPPPYAARQGTEPSRLVEVATFVSGNSLAEVSRIVVRGARSERISRR
ncbi:MAG: hypothetical protein MUE98_13195 [Rhodobacteraceae bacterium]|jgi:hypothetical protein|nr:hypothetical protein [Paracoccaceae bacterium]